MKRISKYLFVRLLEPGRGQSRYTFMVVNTSNQELGMIEWYGPWRQYCFRANPMAVFSTDCLDNICSFIDRIKNLRVEWCKSGGAVARTLTEWDD